MNERERRGFSNFYEHLREVHFCNGCNKTSVFERKEESKDTMVCRGDNRDARPGCGHEIKDSDVRRLVGDCLKCKRIRRVTHCLRTLQYLCLYCWSVVENAVDLPRPPSSPSPALSPPIELDDESKGSD